jgi:hypothetical protein
MLTILLLMVGQALASEVTNVELSYQQGQTVARIHVDGPVRYTHETEVPKNGRPDRMIVDVLSATHELGAKSFHDLPACVVTAIRTSQFAVSPEKVVRVVFDLTEAPVYRIETEGEWIKIVFDHKTAQSFATWSSAASLGKATQPKPAPAKPTAQASSPVKTVAQQNQAIESDRQSSLSSKPTAAKSTPSTKPSSAFGNYSEPKSAKSSVSEPTPTKAKPKTVTEPVKKTSSADKPVPSPLPKKATSATLAQEKPSPKTAEKPVTKKAESKKSDSGQKELAAKVTKSQPAPTKSADTKPAKKTEVAAKTDSKSKSAQRSTSRFRRQASAKIKGTMVAEFPKRLVVKYQSRGRRDPFRSLVDDKNYESNNPIERQVPNIEGLKLVGIIESFEGGNRALFEDNADYSYMLKSGDKVRNGYVLRVEVDQVFFQIFEYGWSRTVALKMD